MRPRKLHALGIFGILGSLPVTSCGHRIPPLSPVPPTSLEERHIKDANQVLPRATEEVQARGPGQIPTPPFDEPVEAGDTERDINPMPRNMTKDSSIAVGLIVLRPISAVPSSELHGSATLTMLGSDGHLVLTLEAGPGDYTVELSPEPLTCTAAVGEHLELPRIGELQVGATPVTVLVTAVPGKGADLGQFSGRALVVKDVGAPERRACGVVRIERGDPVPARVRPPPRSR